MGVFGVDVGGSGIKGAPVDLEKGDLAADRVRLETPQPATVKHVVKVIGETRDLSLSADSGDRR